MPQSSFAGTNAVTSPHAPVCLQQTSRFFDNLEIYQDMAEKLRTNPDFLMALSSLESGWMDGHNEGLHNLFGVTHGGGNNQSYASFQHAADYWVDIFGHHIEGATTIDEFASGLEAAHYNTVNPFYYHDLKEQLKTVVKFKIACGIK